MSISGGVGGGVVGMGMRVWRLCMHLPEVSGCLSSPSRASQVAMHFLTSRDYVVVAKQLSDIPSPCRVGFPGSSCSPLLNAFWLHSIASPREFSPWPSRRSAAWPGGGTVPSWQLLPRPGAEPGTPCCPRRLPSGRGESASQVAVRITQTPLSPLLLRNCYLGEPGRDTPQPPKFHSPESGNGAGGAGCGGVGGKAARYDLFPWAVMDAGRVAAQWGHPAGPVSEGPRSAGSQDRGLRAPRRRWVGNARRYLPARRRRERTETGAGGSDCRGCCAFFFSSPALISMSCI